MPFYHKLGQIPHKRHTQFKKPNGKLYREELMGLEGFSSLQSILYHHFLPPRVAIWILVPFDIVPYKRIRPL
jgi:homogentisate 1,2-dioxygenase